MELSTQQQLLVEQRLANEKKSAGVSYLLWFFLGIFALHRFYLGKIGSGAAQVALFWVGALLAGVGIGLPLLIIFGIWWIIDAFLIPGMIAEDLNSRRILVSNEVSLMTRREEI